MSSPSIPPLSSDALRERAMELDVSVTVEPDLGETRKRLKLEGVPWLSQKKICGEHRCGHATL